MEEDRVSKYIFEGSVCRWTIHGRRNYELECDGKLKNNFIDANCTIVLQESDVLFVNYGNDYV